MNNLNKQRLIWWLKFIFKSLLAGITIGFGCIAYVVIGPENKILGAFLFSLALLTVIIQNMNLYTGKVGWCETFKHFMFMIPMMICNFIGIMFLGYVMQYTNLDLSYASTIISNKMNMPLISCLVLGICCGVMMFVAVYNFKKALHPLYVIMPIMLFILCGFEHCIANMGYAALANYNGISLNSDIVFRMLCYIIGNGLGSQIYSLITLNFEE